MADVDKLDGTSLFLFFCSLDDTFLQTCVYFGEFKRSAES